MASLRELFCRNLKSLRENQGFSQRELSLKCGFAHSYVGQLERGKKDPSFESLVKLSEQLEVSIVDFFRGEESKPSLSLKEALIKLSETTEDVLQSLSVVTSQVDSELRMAGIWDSEGHVLDFNRTTFEILHGDEKDILGRPVWELDVIGDREDNREWVKDRVRRIKNEPKVYRRQVMLFPPEGDPIETEITLTPISVEGADQNFILCEGHRVEDIRNDTPSKRTSSAHG